MEKSDVIIVGAGHAGAQAAMALRQAGFEGSVTMIGREAEIPYERPPLSKEYLARDKTFDRLYIRPATFWDDKSITMRLNTEVVSLDPEAQTVSLSDGSSMAYHDLIWAGGGDPRALPLPGGDLDGVTGVRTRADADWMMAQLDAGAQNVVVIGGGYIGLEAAAVLIKLGRTVTLLEALPRVLARVAGEDLSAFFEAEHRAHGVDLRTGVVVASIEGEGGKATGVKLAGGEIIPADMVIVGIGIIPSVQPLIAAGAKGSNGVDVDALCRTSLPHIYAVGDCAAHSNGFAAGAVIRLESVQNANDQAKVAANHICGTEAPYKATPWFWSNQYDLKLQTVGLSTGHDATVVRGDPATRSFSVIYLKGGAVIALDCVNAIKDYTQGRKLVEQQIVATPAQLADTGVALKELVPAAA